MSQETQTGTLNQLKELGWGGRWDGGSKGRRYLYTYGEFILKFDRKKQNSIKRLSHKNKLIEKNQDNHPCVYPLPFTKICASLHVLHFAKIKRILTSPFTGLSWWLKSEESACQCRRCGFDPWVGKIPWEENGNPLQYSCLGNPMDKRSLAATVHRFTESDLTNWLTFTLSKVTDFHFYFYTEKTKTWMTETSLQTI